MSKAAELAKPENLEKAQTYIDFVRKNLEPLAEHLKVSVDWLWDILVRQVRVEAIVYLIVIVILSIKSAVLLTIAYKALKKAKFKKGYGYRTTIYKHQETGSIITSLSDDWENKDQYEVTTVENSTNKEGYIVYLCGGLGVLLGVISSITMAVALPKIVTGLVNPEYGAIEKIVEAAKPTVQEQTK